MLSWEKEKMIKRKNGIVFQLNSNKKTLLKLYLLVRTKGRSSMEKRRERVKEAMYNRSFKTRKSREERYLHFARFLNGHRVRETQLQTGNNNDESGRRMEGRRYEGGGAENGQQPERNHYRDFIYMDWVREARAQAKQGHRMGEFCAGFSPRFPRFGRGKFEYLRSRVCSLVNFFTRTSENGPLPGTLRLRNGMRGLAAGLGTVTKARSTILIQLQVRYKCSFFFHLGVFDRFGWKSVVLLTIRLGGGWAFERRQQQVGNDVKVAIAIQQRKK